MGFELAGAASSLEGSHGFVGSCPPVFSAGDGALPALVRCNHCLTDFILGVKEMGRFKSDALGFFSRTPKRDRTQGARENESHWVASFGGGFSCDLFLENNELPSLYSSRQLKARSFVEYVIFWLKYNKFLLGKVGSDPSGARVLATRSTPKAHWPSLMRARQTHGFGCTEDQGYAVVPYGRPRPNGFNQGA